MNESDFEEDVVSVIRDKLSNRSDNPLKDINDIADISEIYLFFDYDFQNKNLFLDEINKQVEELINFFNNENENTRLYIHYPMVESMKCTNELPDDNFVNYVVKRTDCNDFKHFVTQKFDYYKSSDFYELPIDKSKGVFRTFSLEKEQTIRQNWEYLKKQNVSKANYICTGDYLMPKNENDIDQKNIFENQLKKYIIPSDSVSILNAFPIFLYEYFR